MRGSPIASRNLLGSLSVSGEAIVVATDVRALTDSESDAMDAAAERVIGEELRAAFTEAAARWPVLTGRSRAALRIDRGTGLRWIVTAGAGYSAFIRQKGRGGQYVAPIVLEAPIREAIGRGLLGLTRGDL